MTTSIVFIVLSLPVLLEKRLNLQISEDSRELYFMMLRAGVISMLLRILYWGNEELGYIISALTIFYVGVGALLVSRKLMNYGEEED